MIGLPSAYCTLPFGEAAAALVDLVAWAHKSEVECFAETEGHDDCFDAAIRQSADVLMVAWERWGPDPEALERLVTARDPLVCDSGTEVAARVGAPEVGHHLRSRLKRSGPDGRLEWAVARQRDDASEWQLVNLLGSLPPDHPSAESAVAALEHARGGPERPSSALARAAFLEADSEAVEASMDRGIATARLLAHLIPAHRLEEVVPESGWDLEKRLVPVVHRLPTDVSLGRLLTRCERHREDYVVMLGRNMELWQRALHDLRDECVHYVELLSALATVISPSELDGILEDWVDPNLLHSWSKTAIADLFHPRVSCSYRVARFIFDRLTDRQRAEVAQTDAPSLLTDWLTDPC